MRQSAHNETLGQCPLAQSPMDDSLAWGSPTLAPCPRATQGAKPLMRRSSLRPFLCLTPLLTI
jgi:hypothetical protein